MEHHKSPQDWQAIPTYKVDNGWEDTKAYTVARSIKLERQVIDFLQSRQVKKTIRDIKRSRLSSYRRTTKLNSGKRFKREKLVKLGFINKFMTLGLMTAILCLNLVLIVMLKS